MKLLSTHGPRAQRASEPGHDAGALPSLEIELDLAGCSVRVYDPRLFQAARRSFCERLLEAATHQPEICKAEVDLPSASCRIEFFPGAQTPGRMAESFVRAVRGASRRRSFVDRMAWWRRRGKWCGMTAFRLPEGVAHWEAFEREPARLQLRRPGGLGTRAQLSRLADSVAGIEGVEACRVSRRSGRMIIDVSRESPLSERLLDTVEQALACLKAAELLRPESPAPAVAGDVDVATGGRRLMYLGMAGGAFSLTLVGLVVPGMPTVPFLLATSYYLARSSPALDRRLRHTSFFGPILTEWEERGGLGRTSKAKLAGLTLAIVAVTVILAPLAPVTLLVIVVIALVSLYGIARMPHLAEEPAVGGQDLRLALAVT